VRKWGARNDAGVDDNRFTVTYETGDAAIGGTVAHRTESGNRERNQNCVSLSLSHETHCRGPEPRYIPIPELRGTRRARSWRRCRSRDLGTGARVPPTASDLRLRVAPSSSPPSVIRPARTRSRADPEERVRFRGELRAIAHRLREIVRSRSRDAPKRRSRITLRVYTEVGRAIAPVALHRVAQELRVSISEDRGEVDGGESTHSDDGEDNENASDTRRDAATRGTATRDDTLPSAATEQLSERRGRESVSPHHTCRATAAAAVATPPPPSEPLGRTRLPSSSHRTLRSGRAGPLLLVPPRRTSG